MAGFHVNFYSSSSDDDRPVPWQRNSQLRHNKSKKMLSFHTTLSFSLLPQDHDRTLFLADLELLQLLSCIRSYALQASKLISDLEAWKQRTGRSIDVNLSTYQETLSGYKPGYCVLDWVWGQIREGYHGFPSSFFCNHPSGLGQFRTRFSTLFDYLKTQFPLYDVLLFFSEVDFALLYPERLRWDLEKYSTSPFPYLVCLTELGLHSPGDVFEEDLSTVLIRFIASLDFTYVAKAAKVFSRSPSCSSPGCSQLRKLKYMLTVKDYDIDYCNPLEGSALHVFMRKLGDAIQAKKTHKFLELYSLVLGLFGRRYSHFHIRYRDKTPLQEFQDECTGSELCAVETVYHLESRKVDKLKLLWVYHEAVRPPLPLSLLREVLSFC